MRRTFIVLMACSFTGAIAQTQSADYNRLSAATKNAFSVAERQYTYKIEFKSTNNGTAPAAGSSASGSKSSVSSNYNSYPAINVNQRRLEKQAEAGARQEARLAAFDTKMKKVDELIRSRGLQRSVEFQSRLVQAAIDGGLTPYEASRFFGNSPEEYRTMLATKNASNYNWSGGVKGDCQGDCSENLTSPYGFTYTGNTKYGKPHGKGVMVGQTATYRGEFLAGEPNGQVEIKWNSGSNFTGYVWNGEMTKGTFKQGGLTFTGAFINGTYYRGLMKVDGVEMLGEFNKTPSFVMGMRVYSNGDTTYGYYKGADESATYYRYSSFKSGTKAETIYDNDNKVMGTISYYNNGSIYYGVQDSTHRRVGWYKTANDSGFYAYLFTDKMQLSPLNNLTAEQNAFLKQKVETFTNEVQRRREEYKEKMEPVYEAIKL